MQASRLPRYSMSEDSPCSQPVGGFSSTLTRSSVFSLQGAAPHQPVNLGSDFAQIVEIEIDAGESDIGNLIDIRQLIQHQIADHFARDLCPSQALNSVFDEVGNALHALAADRAFDRGDADAGEQLLSVERLPMAIPFGDEQTGRNMLIGREALLAIQALATTADGLSSIAGVDHLVLVVSAMGTLHFFNRFSTSQLDSYQARTGVSVKPICTDRLLTGSGWCPAQYWGKRILLYLRQMVYILYGTA